MELVTLGSSTPLRAHGKGGASATISFLSAPPPEKIAGGFPTFASRLRTGRQQAGKKEGGLGEGIFARLPSREAGLGWERLRSLAPSREAKQNIFQFLLPARRSLGAGGEEKGSHAKIEKREKCFASRRRQAGGAAGRVNSVQSRFALRSVIATIVKHCRQSVAAVFHAARSAGGIEGYSKSANCFALFETRAAKEASRFEAAARPRRDAG